MIERRRSARWVVVLVATLAVILGVSNGALARSASTDAGSFTYDAPVVTRVDARAFSDANADGTQLGGASERRASPSRPAQGASTTPPVAFVATNSVGNGMGGAGEMSMVRTVGRGEKIADLVDEGKRLTFETGNEYALVKLANGERAIVSGGPTGIALSDDVTRVFAHSHPYHLPATGPSAADFGMLSAFGQRSSWLLEHGTLSRFGVR